MTQPPIPEVCPPGEGRLLPSIWREPGAVAAFGLVSRRVGRRHPAKDRNAVRACHEEIIRPELGARIGQALVSPALSFSMAWLIVKLAGVCEGGNSTKDWTI